MPFSFSRHHTAGSSGADVLKRHVKSIMSSAIHRLANHRIALTRVPLAFCLCYLRSSPLLVSVNIFDDGPDTPGAKRFH